MIESYPVHVSPNPNLHTNKSTYRPTSKNIRHSRSHINILPHHKIGRMHCNLILHVLSLFPRLFPYNPHPCTIHRIRRFLGDNEFQSSHGFQSPFESFACLDEREHAGVTESLLEENCIVGGTIEVGRGCKVEED